MNLLDSIPTITAINPKYTAIANRLVKAEYKESQIVNNADLCVTEREINANLSLQDKVYNRISELNESLPLRERANVQSFLKLNRGY
jgi:hypothetical protein